MISSPTLALALSAVFVNSTFGTFVSAGGVGGTFGSSVSATFAIVCPSAALIVFTLNVIVTLSPALIVCFTFNTLSFQTSLSSTFSPFTVVVPLTKFTYSVGILSVIVPFQLPSPLFFAVIVYVSSSPTLAVSLSTDFLISIFGRSFRYQ